MSSSRYFVRIIDFLSGGAMALGAAMGMSAILTHTAALLPFIGLVFLADLFFVGIDWTSREVTGGHGTDEPSDGSLAPLHRYFRLARWSEWQIVGLFWVTNAAATALGLWLWFQGALPKFS